MTHEAQPNRFLDWRFLAALAGLILVATIFYNARATAQDNAGLRADQEVKNAQIAELIALVHANENEVRLLRKGQIQLGNQYVGLIKHLADRDIEVPKEFTRIPSFGVSNTPEDLPGKSEKRNPKGQK